MSHKPLVVIFLSICFSGPAFATDFFSLLDVQYEEGMKKTFLGGPFSGKAWCEKLNKAVWDNVRPVCGNCKNELQACGHWSELNGPFRKVMNGEPAPFVYVLVNKKNRIIFSGTARMIVEQECEATAQNFRANGYQEARCIR